MIPAMNRDTDWQVVRLRDVEPKPWRNGGGTTRELAAWPRGHDEKAWQWRASVAEVAADGPFSSFAGVQRWFAVLGGDGVCLTVDGYMHMLSKSDAPLQFDGGAQTDCELLGGATRDFNLMLKGSATGQMLRVLNRFKTTLKTPKTIATYAHKSKATVQIGNQTYMLLPHSLGWISVPGDTAVRVTAGNALYMEIDA